MRDRRVLREERKKGTVVKGGENARGMKEEETQEGTEKRRERTADHCLWCKRILNWSHQHKPT